MVSCLGSLVQLYCGEGGALQTDITGVCGERLQCRDHTGCAPAQGGMCFPGLHCSGSGFLCRALSKAGPSFQVLPRSEPLRFRFSGTPQGHRLSSVGVLCPSQVGAAQATRCLVSAHSPGEEHVLSPPRSQPLGFLSVPQERRLRCRCAVCLPSWELISGCDPPGRCQPSRIPGRLA